MLVQRGAAFYGGLSFNLPRMASTGPSCCRYRCLRLLWFYAGQALIYCCTEHHLFRAVGVTPGQFLLPIIQFEGANERPATAAVGGEVQPIIQ
jgi:hypothetical protein